MEKNYLTRVKMQILSKILDLSYDFLKNVTLNKTAKVVINKFKKSNIDLYQAKKIFLKFGT